MAKKDQISVFSFFSCFFLLISAFSPLFEPQPSTDTTEMSILVTHQNLLGIFPLNHKEGKSFHSFSKLYLHILYEALKLILS